VAVTFAFSRVSSRCLAFSCKRATVIDFGIARDTAQVPTESPAGCSLPSHPTHLAFARRLVIVV
jgi:hypothetical protein